MNGNLRTRPPINAFVLGVIMILLIWKAVLNPVWIIYMVPIWMGFYILFCRYCCTITIDYYEIKINYIAFWNKNISIKIEDISKIDYAKGFYDFFSDKHIVFYGLFPMYCHDRLIIHLKGSKIIEANVNTRLFEFKRVTTWAKEMNLLS